MDIQIAKIIFHTSLTVMKQILDLVAFKVEKNSEDYKFYKKEIMNYFYNGLKDLFKRLSDNKKIEKCHCKANLRKGFSSCEKCGGCGWTNKKTE